MFAAANQTTSLPADMLLRVGTTAQVRRVQSVGGHVMNNRVGGSLAVTRAFGDHALKGAAGGGVTAEPYCCTRIVDRT